MYPPRWRPGYRNLHRPFSIYVEQSFFIWFRRILFLDLAEVNGPALNFGACLGNSEPN